MRRTIWMFAVTALIAGCSETHPKMSMDEMMKKATPAPELAKLNPMVGNWTGTAEMVKPTADEMKKMMPADAAQKFTGRFNGGSNYQWTLNGMYLEGRGWHERHDGTRDNFMEVMGWDAKTKKYWSGFVSDSGDRGEVWTTVSADGKTFTSQAKGCDGHGNPTTGQGTMTFVDNNTINWTWVENGAMGRMELKGTTKRSM